MKKNTILVIEDEEEIRKNLAIFLRFSDFQVFEAENGKQGIEMALEILPDLIISDVMMPIVDGFGVLKELQNRPETFDIPFLFLTAKYSNLDIREGMNLGADDYISKPFDFDEIIRSINKRLEKKNKKFNELQTKIESLQLNIKNAMPHEIRTPLNIILGLTDFLKTQYDNISKSELIEILDSIHSGAKRMQNLFEKYLFFANLELLSNSYIERNNLKKFKTDYPDTLIYDIIFEIAYREKRTDDLDIELESGTIKIQDYYLIKIVGEIADNCMKFSEKGKKIIVKSKKEEQYYVLSITDFGRGLTQTQIENIDAYVQFERKMYEQQGSGLGLVIVKKITEIHDGKFSINSKINEYTTVKVALPLE